jgi:lysyl oxidase
MSDDVKIRAIISAAALFAALGFTPAPAATPVGTLTPAQQLVQWSDSVATGFVNPLLLVSPAPEIRCLQPDACDEFALTIALGNGFWSQNGDGAIEVAIRWAYDGIVDLDLQVLNAAGDVVAQSVAVDSNAESVFIPNAPDGSYTVRVVPSNTFPSSEDAIHYEGLAQVETLASDPVGQGHRLLPNLRPAPPSGFNIASALNLVPIPRNKYLSCYAEETIQKRYHPTKCLRFNQTIANIGDGPMLMRFGLRGMLTPDTEDNIIMQRIMSSDGTFEDVLVPSTYVFHKAHAHLHYKGFGRSYLYPWNSVTGRGASPAAIGKKIGFCMIDVEMQDEYWGKTGNGPRAHTFPFSCVLPDEIDPAGPQAWVEEGIQVGWADVYGWNLADQFIDITNVPDGVYELVQIANPQGSVIEQTRADNCASTVIRITGDKVKKVADGNRVCPA